MTQLCASFLTQSSHQAASQTPNFDMGQFIKTLSFHWEVKHSAKSVAASCSTLAACWQLQASQFNFSAGFFPPRTSQVSTPSLRGFGGGGNNCKYFFVNSRTKFPNNCKAPTKMFLPLEGGRGFDRQQMPTHLPVLISMRTDAVHVTPAPAQSIKPQPELLSVKYFLWYSHVQ